MFLSGSSKQHPENLDTNFVSISQFPYRWEFPKQNCLLHKSNQKLSLHLKPQQPIVEPSSPKCISFCTSHSLYLEKLFIEIKSTWIRSLSLSLLSTPSYLKFHQIDSPQFKLCNKEHTFRLHIANSKEIKSHTTLHEKW